MKLNCPVYVEEIDDICKQPIEVDAYPGEPRTHWYPGSEPGFVVVEALCGHGAEIEDWIKYYDAIMLELAQKEQDAKERAEEYRYEQWETYDWKERFEIGGEA